ncbi:MULTISPECIES: futalosine hydrolase [Streptomyces]|uniref:Futalosine hydrolase n=3 Tax=Streptomyces TaxID=1883 RepID=A0ABU2R2P4_9ACTN|nr:MULTISPECIES: futalosine hydrolase [unclassified Streptomyces]MDT0410966.1 futalosine hydrolase [Streptomyces sp. DSM 41979]MYQ56970.1 futalosine hydrolase [Streptomyces sp. SID4926]
MRVLIATAVPAERDAVARAFPGRPVPRTLPGGLELLAVPDPLPSDHLFFDPLLAGPLPVAPPLPERGAEAPGAAQAVHLLATGAGPAAAAAGTAAALAVAALDERPYDLVLSAGIGGGFAPLAPLGTLVVAEAMVAADLGAQTAEGFVPVTDLGFGRAVHLPPAALLRDVTRALSPDDAADAEGAPELPPVVVGEALTVSTVTGTAERAAELRELRPRAASEGMEGFAVAEAAYGYGIPALELRAVSNPVGPRDREAWRIPEALAVLTSAFAALAPVLQEARRYV